MYKSTNKDEGLFYAISIDNEQPRLINMHLNDTVPDWKYPKWWNDAVSNNIIIKNLQHNIKKAGQHTVKYWMVDPGVVLQRIVIEYPGASKYSYLGPPYSAYIKE